MSPLTFPCLPSVYLVNIFNQYTVHTKKVTATCRVFLITHYHTNTSSLSPHSIIFPKFPSRPRLFFTGSNLLSWRLNGSSVSRLRNNRTFKSYRIQRESDSRIKLRTYRRVPNNIPYLLTSATSILTSASPTKHACFYPSPEIRFSSSE